MNPEDIAHHSRTPEQQAELMRAMQNSVPHSRSKQRPRKRKGWRYWLWRKLRDLAEWIYPCA